METKKTTLSKALKTDRQALEKSIFVNTNKVLTDIEKVNEVKNSIDLAVMVLMEGNISPKHAANVLQNRYSEIETDYLTAENQKLEAAASLLGGASALLDVARERINTDAAQKIAELKAKIKPLAFEMYVYFVYFEFIDGVWSLKNDYQKQIERLNSIILTDPEAIARYEKHVKLVELLNELKGEGSSLQTLIENMVKFNHATGEFSMNYKLFDKNNVLPAYF